MSGKILKNKAIHNFFFDSLEIILIFFVIFLILNIFFGQLLIVTGDSMYPTLENQEQILGEKFSLKIIEPKRGEIFIFRHPQDNKLLIKRLVALPGEKVSIEKGNVYINGTILKEEYLKNVFTEPGMYIQEEQEYTIPEDYYLFLGDNRNNSFDGRDWGFTSAEQIQSRAFLIYSPIKNFRMVNK